MAQKDQLKKLIECVDILNDKIEYHNEYAINPTEIMLLEDHNYRETIDSTSSVSGYITVYFSVSTKGGNDYYKITNVTGGYVKHDRSVSVQGQSLTVSQKGRTYSNGTKNQQTTVAKGASSSWSYTPSSSWYAVNGDVAGTMVGAYCVFSLRRGIGNNASAWNFTTNCPVVTNVIG